MRGDCLKCSSVQKVHDTTLPKAPAEARFFMGLQQLATSYQSTRNLLLLF